MTEFRSSEGKFLNLRKGTFTHNGTGFPTPGFMPIVNLITGPPPLFANGGIWKCIKIELFQEAKVPAFMTQILHFTDFGMTRSGLDKWFEMTIPDRIEDQVGYSPFLFVDSGGYRLLYNTSLDIERYGLSPTVKDIMGLQSRFGGDAAATLDYPLPPGLNDLEAKDRIKKTIDNCVKSARMRKRMLGEDALLYMCVHGRDYVEARATVERLLQRMRKERLHHAPLGIAIGSLVPLSGSPRQVIDIVRGVVDGVGACDWVDRKSVPIHAFGVSSRIIPILASLGVDSFDGTSYIQQAQMLRYRTSMDFSYASFFDLDDLHCQCRYCRLLAKEDLETTKRLLKGRSHGKIEFAGIRTIKSYIYALIALHNLQASFDIVQRAQLAASSERALVQLISCSSRNIRMRKNWAYLARHFPEVSDYLWGLGYSPVDEAGADSHNERGGERSEAPTLLSRRKSNREPVRGLHQTGREVSLLLGPDDFDIGKMNYHAPRRKVLLILPCTQRKPYSSSPSHRLVMHAFKEAAIDSGEYHKVSLSGNYGIVPLEFETDPKVQAYDFYLSSTDHKRMDLLVSRVEEFISVQASNFKTIIAYCTVKSYREVIERAIKGVPNAIILPSPLRLRKATQFKKPENLRQLVQSMKEAIDR